MEHETEPGPGRTAADSAVAEIDSSSSTASSSAPSLLRTLFVTSSLTHRETS
jgi:hypothetical protein